MLNWGRKAQNWSATAPVHPLLQRRTAVRDLIRLATIPACDRWTDGRGLRDDGIRTL